jgi:hypothetical protein
MYIKAMVNSLNPLDIKPVDKPGKLIKADETHDRDANGQQSFSGDEKEHPPMTDEQFEKALQSLRMLPSIKENKWSVSSEVIESERFAVIKDNLGTVIRKITEKELWTLKNVDKDSPKGHLFKRTA